MNNLTDYIINDGNPPPAGSKLEAIVFDDESRIGKAELEGAYLSATEKWSFAIYKVEGRLNIAAYKLQQNGEHHG